MVYGLHGRCVYQLVLPHMHSALALWRVEIHDAKIYQKNEGQTELLVLTLACSCVLVNDKSDSDDVRVSLPIQQVKRERPLVASV